MKTRIALLLAGTLQSRVQGWASPALPPNPAFDPNPSSTVSSATYLEASLARAIVNTQYQQPAPTELDRARSLFQQTLTRSRAMSELQTEWSKLGFELRPVSIAQESLWVLSEPAGKQAGRGWYLFRDPRREPARNGMDGLRSASPVALEAPHARNDVHTGLIALRLFLEGNARVLACATITRRRADMAHLTETFFQAFTLAFAESCPTGLVVQVHGFDSRNHSITTAEVVASTGSKTPEPWLSQVANDLSKCTSLSVLAYPKETRQLGGTRNAQANALHQSTQCRFLHLEMSRDLRNRLTEDATLRRIILNCVSRIPRE